jgi:predicted DNA-binding transcriptional regulator YafY
MPISRLSRLTAILTQLQSKGMITASDIADRFDVSVRTVYRDIRALEEAGVPISVDEGKGYRLVDGYKLPPVMFSEEEANALLAAEKIILRNKDHSLVKHYNDAMIKIKAILRHTEKDKVDMLSERMVYIKNVSEESTSNYLSTLQRAITNFDLINIHYQTGYSNEYTIRDVESQALYHSQDNWVLIAWCRLRNDYREFRLDRIISMTTKKDKFESRDFDLMKYFYSILSP